MFTFMASRYRLKTKMAQNYGLGRGLSSLIPQKKNKIDKPQKDFNYFGKAVKKVDPTSKDKENIVQKIDINNIVANPYQPRTNFNEDKLYELAESIKQYGIIQPVVVSQKGNHYEIIAGERRWQAAKMAGLSELPAIIKVADEQQKLELAIIENIQRQDLDSIEEAKSYRELINKFSLTQEEIAKKLGKSRSAVANKIRLLNLPIEIQKALTKGEITEGHARLLLAIPNPEKQRAFFEMIIKNKLTVRQTERKTKEILVQAHKRNVSIDPKIKRWEDEFSQALGTKVKIKKSGNGGRIIIDYYSDEEIDGILKRIA